MKPSQEHRPEWLFGAATADITPTEPILLAGYMRDVPASEVRNPIHAKAAYFRAANGDEAVIINADVVGFSTEVVQRMAGRVFEAYGIPADRVIFHATHNHSGPIVEGVLPLFHDFTDADHAAMRRYTDALVIAIADCIGEARAAAVPCFLETCNGVAGFAVNRRRAADHLRHLPTVVDQDVPVLVATSAEGQVRGILFGYACHTTVMYDNFIDGDYSGYAQDELEQAFPGSTALFLTGCGGDINPLPRRSVTLSQSYGNVLASAVIEAIGSDRRALPGDRIRAASRTLDLPLTRALTRAELEAILDENTLRARVLNDQFRPLPPDKSEEEIEHQIKLAMAAVRRKIRHQLVSYDLGEPITAVPYAIQILELGGQLKFVALAGEPVADYSLRLKERHGFLTTWPVGYCNDLVAYIPSLRVLREGGYEGKTAMLEYGLPGHFTEEIEHLILTGIDEMIAELHPASAKKPAEIPAAA